MQNPVIEYQARPCSQWFGLSLRRMEFSAIDEQPGRGA